MKSLKIKNSLGKQSWLQFIGQSSLNFDRWHFPEYYYKDNFFPGSFTLVFLKKKYSQIKC